MHRSSIEFMTLFKDEYLLNIKGCSILDIGSRNVDPELQLSYRHIFEDDYKYTGMDIEPGNNVDIVGFNNIKGMLFDVVISGQTLEHINRPWDWLKSLVPLFNKYICIIAPHTFKEHKHPIDTYRYFPDGMVDLFNYAEIKIVDVMRNKNDTMGIGVKL